MDLPKPPEDIELKNIIDKLAQFVARNGPEFEQMTKQKQRDNPNFSFLFGGAYFNYYQYRVTTEQAIIRQKQRIDTQMGNNNNNNPMPGFPPSPNLQFGGPLPPSVQSSGPNHGGPMGPGSSLNLNQRPPNVHFGNHNMTPPLPSGLQHLDSSPNVYSQQVHEIQDSIRESEQNLAAQHQMLMKQQQIAIDETIRKSQEQKVNQMAQECNINLHEFESILQPIAEACTNDSISVGKSWIFSKCQAPMQYDVIMSYIQSKIVTPGLSFDSKLHLLYLINDLLNHCFRKREEQLQRAIEKIIIPIYCYPYVESDEEKRGKLGKLLRLWESHQYFDKKCLDQLQNPQAALMNHQTSLCNEYAPLLAPITSGTVAKYNQLQKQHQEFTAHQSNKIQQIQQQSPAVGLSHSQQGPPSHQQFQHSQAPQTPSPFMSNQPFGHQGLPPPPQPPMFPPMLPQRNLGPPPNQSNPNTLPLHLPPQTSHHGPPPPFIPQNQPLGESSPSIKPTSVPNPQFFSTVPPSTLTAQPPPPLQAPQNHIPLLGPHPTPTVPPPAQLPFKDSQPDVPYWELPAGLMVPLVKLEDFEYKPLDPSKIRLPPPTPPSERLLKAVAAFFAPPSHDRPRNAEGWEQLGLYEFFRAKSQAKDKNDDRRSRSDRSPSSESNDGHRISSSHRHHRDRSSSSNKRHGGHRRSRSSSSGSRGESR